MYYNYSDCIIVENNILFFYQAEFKLEFNFTAVRARKLESLGCPCPLPKARLIDRLGLRLGLYGRAIKITRENRLKKMHAQQKDIRRYN